MGEALPSLGVGICALNEARDLPRLLSRLLQGVDADDRAGHVVVADGGSTDGTPEIARRMGAEVLDVGRGRGLQLRAAAQYLLDQRGPAAEHGSTGVEVMLFLHADSIPRTGSITALRRAFSTPSEGEEADGAEPLRAAAMRQTIVAEGRKYRWIERAANGRARRGMVYGDSGLAVCPDLYEAAGGFPEWPLFEDVALSKAIRKICPIRLVESATLAISPRRWQKEGVIRCTGRNVILRGLFECGVSPERLARLYRPHSKGRDSVNGGPSGS